MNIKFILLIILFYNIILLSQEYSFNNYSSLEGLSSNTVHSIIQDKKGFIWLGTEEGLNRFDGYSFKIFKHEVDDSASLSNNVIWSLCEDKDGFIWLATDRGGLDKFDPVTEKFYHYQNIKGNSTSIANNSVQCVYVDSKNTVWAGTWEGGLNKFNRESNNFTRYLNEPGNPYSLSNNRIFSILEDENGNLWIGTDGGGISVLNIKTNKFTNYKHDPDNKNSLPGDNVLSLFEDNTGKIWIGTYGYGLSIFDPQKNIFKTYKSLKDENSISQNIIWSIYQDSRGLIWLGTLSNGITIYNPADKSFTRIHHDPLNPKSISSDYIKNMFEDRSGVLWIGSVAGGVNKIDRKPPKFLHIKYDPKNPNSISNNSIYSLYKDSFGYLWFGGDKNRLERYNPEDKSVKEYISNPSDPNSLNGEIIRCIFEDSQKDLWITTFFGSLQKYNRKTDSFTRIDLSEFTKKSRDVVNIRTVYEDENKILWFGSYGGGLLKYDRSNNSFKRFCAETNPDLENDNVIAICKGPPGFLWIGTHGGGLYKFDKSKETFKAFKNDPENPNSLNDDSITELFLSSKGILWIGTYNGGLNMYDKNKNSFLHFTEKEGMGSNTICDIIEDKNGIFWISTFKGITRFDPETFKIKNYDLNDGASDEYSPGAAFLTEEGLIYFGGFKQITYFNPDSLNENHTIPQIAVTSFKTFNKEYNLGKNPAYVDTITLSYNDTFFSFEFSALDFTLTSKNHYAYKLEGFDKNWIYAGSRNFASYTNIEPGKYIFKVKGTNNDGIWNEKGASIQLIITPPFWATWWFRGIALLGLLGFAGFIYKRRIYNLEKEREAQEEFSKRLIQSQEEERKRIASELHDSLGQNLLIIKNRAALGIKSNEHDFKSKQLDEISSGATSAIEEVRRISYNLHPYHLDRLGLTKAIKSIIENLDSTSNINFELSCSNIDNLLNKKSEINLFRIVQECINNIIKHSGASEAEIKINRKNNWINIEIIDNGKGFNSEDFINSNDPAKGFGIRNLQKRTNILNGKIKMDSSKENGTYIIINIPIIND